MPRRFTSFLIPIAALLPGALSCGSDSQDAETPTGVETETPDMMGDGEPGAPDTPPAMETPVAEDPAVPGAGEQLPGDIDLEPTQPEQPTQPTTPGELTTPVPPAELAPLDCGP